MLKTEKHTLMKTILIPTNYQAASLNSVRDVCELLKDDELKLVFVHMFKLSDSIGEMLMLSRRSREYENVSDEFYKGCVELRNQYDCVKAIKIDFLYGSTMSMFRTFLEDNEIDMVLDAKCCTYSPIHKSSIDPGILVQKSGLPIINSNRNKRKQELNIATYSFKGELATQV